MLYILKMIVSSILELPFKWFLEADGIKPWVKTGLINLLNDALTVLFVFLGWRQLDPQWEMDTIILVGMIGVGWIALFTGVSIYLHKRIWKKRGE